MYNIIIDFIENDTTKIKKILEKYLFAGNTLRFEEDLMHYPHIEEIHLLRRKRSRFVVTLFVKDRN